MDEKEYTCVICGKKFHGWGNDPWPIVLENSTDRCCDDCNMMYIIPARIELQFEDRHGQS